MKKIIVFGLCLACICVSFAMANDSWTFGIKAESQEMMLKWQPANLMDYSDIKPAYQYAYKLDVAAMKGKENLQGFSLQLGKTLLKKRLELMGGIGFAKINADLDRPEYTTQSSFKTIYGYDSQDKEVCLGESVKSNGKYKPFWFVSAKAIALEKKNWKFGIEGRYLSLSNSDFSLPLQYVSNKWKGAEMEFSIKGKSMKFQMAEAKFFGNLKVSKSLEVSGAAGYLWSKTEISGESLYKYSQDLVNVNFAQNWKLTGKPESSAFAEMSVATLLTKNLKAIVSGNIGAKKGISIGISYSFGGEKTPTPRIITAKPTPKTVTPKHTPQKVSPVVDKPKPKKTITPKEGVKKPAVNTKTAKTPCHTTKTVMVVPDSLTCVFRWTTRLLGLDIINVNVETTVPEKKPIQQKK